MSDHTTVYQAENLSYAYGPHAVLRDVSFRIEAGRFYGIVGPNGSGKTTLLDLLVGAKQPHAGQIRLRGRLVSEYPKKDLARSVALAPQEFAIDFPFTVAEVVMMGRHPHMAPVFPALGLRLAACPPGHDRHRRGRPGRPVRDQPVRRRKAAGGAGQDPGPGRAGDRPGRTHLQPRHPARPAHPGRGDGNKSGRDAPPSP